MKIFITALFLFSIFVIVIHNHPINIIFIFQDTKAETYYNIRNYRYRYIVSLLIIFIEVQPLDI